MSEQAKQGGVEQTDVIEILEQLCGWRWFRYLPSDGTYSELVSPESAGAFANRDTWREERPENGTTGYETLPSISTDETAAVNAIVPQLRAAGLELVVSWPVDDRPRAQIFRVPEPMALYSEQGETAAEAICLAALSMIRGREQ